MKTLVLLLCAAFAAAPVAAAVNPAPSPPKSATEAEPSPKMVAMAERLQALIAPRAEREVSSMFIGALISAMAAKAAKLSKQEAQEFGREVDAVMPEVLEASRQEAARTWAKIYTEEELTAMLRFYDSSIGRSIAAKQLQVSVQSGIRAAGVNIEVVAKARERFCRNHPRTQMCRQAATQLNKS